MLAGYTVNQLEFPDVGEEMDFSLQETLACSLGRRILLSGSCDGAGWDKLRVKLKEVVTTFRWSTSRFYGEFLHVCFLKSVKLSVFKTPGASSRCNYLSSVQFIVPPITTS